MITPRLHLVQSRADRTGRPLSLRPSGGWTPALGVAVALCLVPLSLAAEKAKKSQGPKAAAAEAAQPVASVVKLVDGIVQPVRPVTEAIADGIRFLRKADGAYVPGRIDGELAGYFMSALVNADGSRNNRRQLSFPARHHAYFIETFLQYYRYTGEKEWLLRAGDLANWNLTHSTPATAAYPYLPYSAHQDDKPTGSADKNSIETDKPAFLGSAYLQLYETTSDQRYLNAARQIAATLVGKQRDDGSWPFRVIPEDGSIFQDLGGAPVFFVEFFDHIYRYENRPEYLRARDRAARLMIARNVEQGQWGTYHEDIHPRPGDHLSAEPMSFTAAYLFQQAAPHPEYVEMGRRVLRQMEARLVFTEGHGAAPAPAVAEQATFAHIMAGHTARYCWALSELYRVTGDVAVKNRALSGLNAVTYMQSEAGLFRTHFYDTKQKKERDPSSVNNWYSQHLYTICHMLQCMAAFPELSPNGQNHLLGSSVGVGEVSYAGGAIQYSSAFPAEVSAKLNFVPRSVLVGGRALAESKSSKTATTGEGWSFDAQTKVLTVRHGAGKVSVGR